MKRCGKIKYTALFLLAVWANILFAQKMDTSYYPNDTLFLDSTAFLVKVVESVYSKPARWQGRVGSAAVYFKGDDFWYIEDYSYYKNGSLKLVDFYSLDSFGDSIGKLIYYKHFLKNGFIKEEASLADNDYFENAYHFYYRNGTRKAYFQFKDSLYHGLYREYYKNGQLKTERSYENGRIVSVNAFYDRTGFPLFKGDFRQGNGDIKIYNDKGKLKRTYSFRSGELYKTKKN